MADEYGVPQPDCAEDFQQFMLSFYDLGTTGMELGADERALDLLRQARNILIDEFEVRFPGYGTGRAVWR